MDKKTKIEKKNIEPAAMIPEIYEYDHFCLLYIDNSHAERGDGLTAKAKELIDSIATMLTKAEDARFFIYGSNGITPEVCDDKTRVAKAIEKMTEVSNSQHPDDKLLDRDQLRAVLYEQPFLVTKSITMHYFVTEYFTKSLFNDNASTLISAFAEEIRYILSGNRVPAKINFYYTSKSGEVKKETLQSSLLFRNPDKGLSINTIPLN